MHKKQNTAHINQKMLFWSHLSSSPLACPHELFSESMHTVIQCSPDEELLNINISRCEKGLQFSEVTLCSSAALHTITPLAFGQSLLGGKSTQMNSDRCLYAHSISTSTEEAVVLTALALDLSIDPVVWFI